MTKTTIIILILIILLIMYKKIKIKPINKCPLKFNVLNYKSSLKLNDIEKIKMFETCFPDESKIEKGIYLMGIRKNIIDKKYKPIYTII